MTLDAENIDASAYQLRHIKAENYSGIAPAWLTTTAPNLTALIDGTAVLANTSVAELTTRGNVSFTHCAKSALWNDDLYENLVAPTFDQGFMWETWRRNPYTEPTYCTACGHAYDSVNIESISFGDELKTPDGALSQFRYTHDHCKVSECHEPYAFA